MEGEGASQAYSLFRQQAAAGIFARRALLNCQMKLLIFFLVGVVMSPVAPARRQTCPANAPVSWGIGQKALESVRVMSYPVDVTPNADREYYATPPWQERESAGQIFQTWFVNRDLAEFRYEVDCVYEGTSRFVRLDVDGVRRCVARWRARGDHGVVPRSLVFSCD